MDNENRHSRKASDQPDTIEESKTLPAGGPPGGAKRPTGPVARPDIGQDETLAASSVETDRPDPEDLVTGETLPGPAAQDGRSPEAPEDISTLETMAADSVPRNLEAPNAAGQGAGPASGTLTAKESGPPAGQDLTDVTPECPGRYTVLWEAGRGGIGRVVLAEDGHTGRQIAIKELLLQNQPPATATGSVTGATARFLWEARITAQLEHPAIVPVYEIGKRNDGTYYYTMKFIRGKTLADAIAEGPDVSDRLSLLPHFCSLCNAVAFAHSRGILHRDIKPGNVMLGEFGETVVIDWGLAKQAGGDDRDNSLFARQAEVLRNLAAGGTMVGQAVGTPAYMPPEQARGKHDDVDELSDVYALGAVLYQILTGRPPFTGRNAQDILLKVIGYAAGNELLLSPMDIDPDVPPELSAVTLKALSVDKKDRYVSAKDLVRDVEAFMTGRRVSAYRYSKAELVGRFVRRHKASVAAAAAVTLAILSALVITSISYQKERTARRRERRARIQEHAQRLTAHWHLARAHLHKALTLAADHRMLEAGLFAAKGLEEDPTFSGSAYHDPGFQPPREPDRALMEPELASMLYLARTSALKGVTRIFELHQDPRRLFLSVATGNLIVSSDRSIETLGIEPGHRRLSPPDGRVLGADRKGRALLLRKADGRLSVWEPATGRESRLSPRGSSVIQAAFLDSRFMATGSVQGRLAIWDLRSKSRVFREDLFVAPLNHLAACPKGTLAAAAGRQLVVLRNALTKKDPINEKKGKKPTFGQATKAHWEHITTSAPVTALEISPDCRLLAVGFDDGTILLLSLTEDLPARRMSAHRDMVTSLRFSRSGNLLASGSWDGTLRLWNTTGQQLVAVTAHEQGVRDLAFSPNADMIVTTGADRRVLLWQLAQPMPITAFRSAVGRIKAVAISQDGRFVAAGGTDRAAAIWNQTVPNHPVAHLLGESTVRALAFSPDAKTFYYAFGGSLVSTHCPDGGVIANIRAYGGTIRSLLVCPKNGLLFTAGLDGHLRGWDPSTGKKRFDLAAKSSILRAALSPDCREAATATRNGEVLLWSLDHPDRAPRVLVHQPHLVTAVAYSPDGKLVASAGQDAVILIQEHATGRVLARLRAHQRWINRVAFSPDGRLLTSGGDDRKVWLWNTATWRPILFIPTQREALALAFSPDGKKLALGDATRLLLYPMDIEHLTANPDKLLEDLTERLGLPSRKSRTKEANQ